MSKVSKIERYDLDDEAQSLLDSGFSLSKVAKTLKQNHPEISDLKSLSSMSVMRWRDSKNQKEIESDIEEGKDPVDNFTKEYRVALKKVLKKNEKWYKEAEELYQEAKENGSITERAKILKEVRDTLSQDRKNWVALQQYGTRQVSNIYNINLKKEQNIKLMLLNWSKEILDGLCPKCKSKSKDKILEIVRTKKEEEIYG